MATVANFSIERKELDVKGVAVVSSVDAATLVAGCQGNAAGDAVAGYENASLKPLIYRT